MEQKISGCWVNLENMDLGQLEFWANACQNALIRAKEDLNIVEGEIIKYNLEIEPPDGNLVL